MQSPGLTILQESTQATKILPLSRKIRSKKTTWTNSIAKTSRGKQEKQDEFSQDKQDNQDQKDKQDTQDNIYDQDN